MRAQDEMILTRKQEINFKQRRALLRVLKAIDSLKSEESSYTQTPEMRAYMAARDSITAIFGDLNKCENGLLTRTL